MIDVSPVQAQELINQKLPKRVALLPLIIREEKSQLVVGSPESGKFVILPDIGVEIVRYLQEGLGISKISSRLKSKKVKVDLKQFLISLVKLGFVVSFDNYNLRIDTKGPTLPWIQPNQVAWLFSWPMYLIYSLLVASAIVTLFFRPWLFPDRADFFWTSRTSLVILTNFGISNITVMLHELAHLIAARSRGVNGRLGIGTRLHMLVAKTDVSGVWGIPKNLRYRVYLAGIGSNILTISLGILALAYLPIDGMLANLIKVMILIVYLSLFPQLYLHIRMDLYYVLLNRLDCYNLFSDARSYFWFQVHKIWQRIRRKEQSEYNPLSLLPGSEERKVKIYSWFMVTGVLLSVFVFLYYRLPINLWVYYKGFLSAREGITNNDFTSIFDGLLTLSISGFWLLLFLIVYIKNHKSLFGRFFNRFVK